MTIKSGTSSSRLYELDGLRGIASLIVFFSHVSGLLILSNVLTAANNSILHIFWDGTASVMLFFVLSGFVLTLPYVSGSNKEVDIVPFTIRRVFRIYPAYIFAILLSFGFQKLLFVPGSLSGLSSWINSFWQAKTVTWLDLVKHFMMIGPNFDTHLIDPVIWSLIVEMKISLVFPFFIYTVKKINNRILLSVFFLFMAGVGYFSNNVLMYLPIFIFGSLLAKFIDPIKDKFKTFSWPIVFALSFIAMMLYACKFWLFSPNESSKMIDYLTGAGAGLMIVLTLSIERITAFFRLRPIEFLGKISYSFYLLHLPILLTCFSLLFPWIKSIFICSFVSLIASFIISYFMYRAVELPFQKLGKAISKKISLGIFSLQKHPYFGFMEIKKG